VVSLMVLLPVASLVPCRPWSVATSKPTSLGERTA
jgi:hypothetical protein